MSLKKKEKEKVRPESCYIYKSTLAQQDESTFILNLAVISVNEERGSEYLRNEICVCNSALESVVLICTIVLLCQKEQRTLAEPCSSSSCPANKGRSTMVKENDRQCFALRTGKECTRMCCLNLGLC